MSDRHTHEAMNRQGCILAGDIGGTKVNLAIFAPGEGGLECLYKETFPSQSYPTFSPLLEAFRSHFPVPLVGACLGVAGPVVNGRCETTNLPWVLEASALATLLSVPRAWLINDLEATAHGIPALAPSELLTLQEGVPMPGNRALIAAGTGLGESLLYWDGQTHLPSPSEGGHTDFGPRNEWEIGLLRFLTAQYGHVSYERILSGAGFVDIYRYLVVTGALPAPEVAAEVAEADDAAPVISAAGLSGRCPVCVEVLQRFTEIYGAEAGNLALKCLAVNGVYVGGGIAPRLLERLTDGSFLAGFKAKGRFHPLLERTPVHVILNPEAALLGAARYVRLQPA